MKKIIIFLLILFSLITFNKISYAEYDNHTLQFYSTTIAQNSEIDDLPDIPQILDTEEKNEIDKYLKKEEPMNTNIFIKAIKALFLACISFFLFVAVILMINKFFFKKNISLNQTQDIQIYTPEKQNEELEKIQDNYNEKEIPPNNIDKVIYDFYKRNIN